MDVEKTTVHKGLKAVTRVSGRSLRRGCTMNNFVFKNIFFKSPNPGVNTSDGREKGRGERACTVGEGGEERFLKVAHVEPSTRLGDKNAMLNVDGKDVREENNSQKWRKRIY